MPWSGQRTRIQEEVPAVVDRSGPTPRNPPYRIGRSTGPFRQRIDRSSHRSRTERAGSTGPVGIATWQAPLQQDGRAAASRISARGSPVVVRPATWGELNRRWLRIYIEAPTGSARLSVNRGASTHPSDRLRSPKLVRLGASFSACDVARMLQPNRLQAFHCGGNRGFRQRLDARPPIRNVGGFRR